MFNFYEEQPASPVVEWYRYANRRAKDIKQWPRRLREHAASTLAIFAITQVIRGWDTAVNDLATLLIAALASVLIVPAAEWLVYFATAFHGLRRDHLARLEKDNAAMMAAMKELQRTLDAHAAGDQEQPFVPAQFRVTGANRDLGRTEQPQSERQRDMQQDLSGTMQQGAKADRTPEQQAAEVDRAAVQRTDVDELGIAKNAREEKLQARRKAPMTPEELRHHEEMERLYRQQVLKEQPTIQIKGLGGRTAAARELAELREEAIQNLLNRSVRSDDELQVLKRDIQDWERRTLAVLEEYARIDEITTFRVLGVYNARATGGLNPEHNREIAMLWERLNRLLTVIKRLSRN